MKRREFICSSVIAATAAAAAPPVGGIAPLPHRDRIRVAFMLGDGTNVMDTAGPWEVFQDTMVMRKSGGHTHPFELLTVGPSREPLTMTAGLEVIPTFAFDDAPQVHVVVVPAQHASDTARDWLRAAATQADMVMSVCTGAYQLARTGLLDGLSATTHHDYWNNFAREFPNVKVERGPRFVDNGTVATSGGLTSGIDLALHVVSRYFGSQTARATARYLAHRSDHWS